MEPDYKAVAKWTGRASTWSVLSIVFAFAPILGVMVSGVLFLDALGAAISEVSPGNLFRSVLILLHNACNALPFVGLALGIASIYARRTAIRSSGPANKSLAPYASAIVGLILCLLSCALIIRLCVVCNMTAYTLVDAFCIELLTPFI